VEGSAKPVPSGQRKAGAYPGGQDWLDGQKDRICIVETGAGAVIVATRAEVSSTKNRLELKVQNNKRNDKRSTHY
jgi:hypothetical protein